MAIIQVQKREGGLEDWSFDKLLASITKAGVPLEEAKHVASLVEAWALKSEVKGIMIFSQIRDRVIQLLKVVDPVAAGAYESFKK